MVISAISDGLGNQMFQYACGRALAEAKQVPFKLDINWFSDIDQRFTKRLYSLDKLNIKDSIASNAEIKKLKEPIYPFIINSIYWRIQYALPYYKRHFFKEAKFTFDDNIHKTPDNVYLQGFFQSYKYFEGIRESLINEFMPKLIPTNILEKVNEIKNSPNTVSLHIRRGDYLHIGNAQYVLDLSYYVNAIDFIKTKVGDIKVYVFSDEPLWAKQNLQLNTEMKILDMGGEIAECDIYMMSLCKHNIIANSSFSWWAAWLNNNVNKTVVAPKEWFKGNSKNTADLIPADWIRI
jgi:hypothetical protein